jgi:peptidoglycan hydrolase-like protein with peptidoglycan-binding domain
MFAYPGTALRRGSNGPDVRDMQQRLSDLGYSLDVDGNFGPGTATAVTQFQQAKGLGSDGIVDPNTWKALWAV